MAQEPPERVSSSRDGRTGPSTATPSKPVAPHEPPAAEMNAYGDEAAPPVVGMGEYTDQSRRGTRSRHDGRMQKRDKNIKFGDYILGNVIGEGEFGKVRLGWKQDDRVQVAIKIIKKESLGNNPSRLAKIHREVNILRGLSHPNIVHLHDMIGDDSRIGIVLEYASGGELFDYILNHRYLKDNAARRLFAQLISGVGYLHKKGIVHRDLKLENLLLDRNKNIIITDFGFANIFDPKDELSEEEELNLSDREFVKRIGLDKIKSNGTRRGDLMQTSCGSPCYAAPELVVSDSLYTGRKVDVWSCGVILYAMLAGYLPFDDDPANPEGDNINLLYKYIVNTPLTFPEYVSPHARDLLKRILVANPRRRADLFEVARHSWLSEYANVVRIITSSTTTPADIQNTTVPAEDDTDGPGIARSASLRDASKPKTAAAASTVGGLTAKHGHIDADEAAVAAVKAQKDAKRRTVQVEYVAPTTQTQRGEYVVSSKSRGQPSNTAAAAPIGTSSPKEKPLPQDPPVAKSSRGGPPSAHRQQPGAGPTRPVRDPRPEDAYLAGATLTDPAHARPRTQGSIQSSASLGFTATGRNAYGQPAPPAVAGTNVHGRIQQPANPGEEVDEHGAGRPSVPSKFARVSGFTDAGPGQGHEGKGHKRSSTIGDISAKLLGRSGSLFGKSRRRQDSVTTSGAPSNAQPASPPAEKNSRKYPPISMANSMALGGGGDEPRQSMDSRQSRRSFSLGLGRKRSGSMSGSHHSQEKHTRRFSLIPSLTKAIGLGSDRNSHQSLPIHPGPDRQGQTESRGGQRNTPIYNEMLTRRQQEAEAAYRNQSQVSASGQAQSPRYAPDPYDRRPNAIPPYIQQHSSILNTGSESSIDVHRAQNSQAAGLHYQAGFSEPDSFDGRRFAGNAKGTKVLQKNKRFADAYDDYPGGQKASVGAARRVMDIFRRRGKARAGDDR
ncbi:unnamed protein product [Parascedosporium putredinis]|uniref:non-specific serine/threonine protein kinase n=1 Tax=Parascedosporium putredinis TaxID=1442378 RepID=A0A9P1H875_9PEZI|nr:unnamed protein product [Parascedosporium putredinis]CAI8001932.1 unnamed protein product [Parascedosporium putredinis]